MSNPEQTYVRNFLLRGPEEDVRRLTFEAEAKKDRARVVSIEITKATWHPEYQWNAKVTFQKEHGVRSDCRFRTLAK